MENSGPDRRRGMAGMDVSWDYSGFMQKKSE
jgi:hypothetical protein